MPVNVVVAGPSDFSFTFATDASNHLSATLVQPAQTITPDAAFLSGINLGKTILRPLFQAVSIRNVAGGREITLTFANGKAVYTILTGSRTATLKSWP